MRARLPVQRKSSFQKVARSVGGGDFDLSIEQCRISVAWLVEMALANAWQAVCVAELICC